MFDGCFIFWLILVYNPSYKCLLLRVTIIINWLIEWYLPTYLRIVLFDLNIICFLDLLSTFVGHWAFWERSSKEIKRRERVCELLQWDGAGRMGCCLEGLKKGSTQQSSQSTSNSNNNKSRDKKVSKVIGWWGDGVVTCRLIFDRKKFSRVQPDDSTTQQQQQQNGQKTQSQNQQKQ